MFGTSANPFQSGGQRNTEGIPRERGRRAFKKSILGFTILEASWYITWREGKAPEVARA